MTPLLPTRPTAASRLYYRLLPDEMKLFFCFSLAVCSELNAKVLGFCMSCDFGHVGRSSGGSSSSSRSSIFLITMQNRYVNRFSGRRSLLFEYAPPDASAPRTYEPDQVEKTLACYLPSVFSALTFLNC